jgi:hypothetical protein
MSDLESQRTPRAQPAIGSTSSPAVRTICPHARTPARNPAIVLLHGFADNQHLSDRLVPPPCPTTRPSSPTAPPGRGVWVPRPAAAGRRVGGRPRGDPGQGAAGAQPSPTLPAWAAKPPDDPAADHAAHPGLGSGQDVDRRHGKLRPPAAPGPDGASTPVNRCGDRTTTPSTRVRHRGLLLAGLCLAVRPPSLGRWPTGRPCTACPPSPRPGP